MDPMARATADLLNTSGNQATLRTGCRETRVVSARWPSDRFARALPSS